jgi:hypothetical protein
MDTTEGLRPATELRQIDRILSQWTADEIARMPGDEARGIARLLEIRANLIQRLEVWDNSCSSSARRMAARRLFTPSLL